MESEDREQGTPQRRVVGDEQQPGDEAMSDEAGYDTPEGQARQEEGTDEAPEPGAGAS